MTTIKVNGKKLQQARKNIGMTLGELSDKIHLSITQISYIENGHRNTSEETLRKIIKVLNTPIIEGGFRRKLLKDYTYNYFVRHEQK